MLSDDNTLQKLYFLDFIEIIFNLSKVLLETTWKKLLPKWLIWRLYAYSMESDTFYKKIYGKISLEIVWDFYGEIVVNQITRQSLILKVNCNVLTSYVYFTDLGM